MDSEFLTGNRKPEGTFYRWKGRAGGRMIIQCCSFRLGNSSTFSPRKAIYRLCEIQDPARTMLGVSGNPLQRSNSRSQAMKAKRRRKAQNVSVKTHLEEEEKYIKQAWSELIDQGFTSYRKHTKPSTKPVLENKVNWSIAITR